MGRRRILPAERLTGQPRAGLQNPEGTRGGSRTQPLQPGRFLRSLPGPDQTGQQALHHRPRAPVPRHPAQRASPMQQQATRDAAPASGHPCAQAQEPGPWALTGATCPDPWLCVEVAGCKQGATPQGLSATCPAHIQALQCPALPFPTGAKGSWARSVAGGGWAGLQTWDRLGEHLEAGGRQGWSCPGLSRLPHRGSLGARPPC